MTCIVSLKERGKIYIGGDSASSSDLTIVTRNDNKVFKNGAFLMGFAESFRFGQLMRFRFKPPCRKSDTDAYQFMCVDFIAQMQKTFREHGFDGTNAQSEKETSGQLLVAYDGELYEIGEDYQVGVPRADFAAIGAGGDLARGALYALAESKNKLSPEQKITIALNAAACYNGSVRPPFTILAI